MVLHSCSLSGEVDDSKFSEPLPWIGLYIAAASLLCSLLMGVDTFYGFRRRKLWFPCSFFSLNATSLTLISVATKLPVDLNTSMPRPQDQLTKLSGTVLLCTVMGNFITSLGTMGVSEMISNIIALGILVVTVIVNIAIQMSTGVIYVFLPEHAMIMFFMLVLLVILCSTALTVPTAKKLLEKQYDEIYDVQSSDAQSDIKKLKEDVRKYWMMAHTSSPQYVVGRSATCTASGAFCLLSALILLQAAVRSLVIRSVHFCQGKSDYSWSMTFVLISQAIAIVVGTIAPAIRWFNAIRFRSPTSRSQTDSSKVEFKVEKYWVERLEEWKENPLPFHIGNRRFRKIVHISKNQILGVFILVQNAVVLVSKLIRLASTILPASWLLVRNALVLVSKLIRLASTILPLSWLTRLSTCCKRQWGEEKGSEELESVSNMDLRPFVLHLEGEEALVQLIMTNGSEDTEHWIRRGNSKPSNYLLQLLKKSQGFQGEVEFDSSIQVPLLGRPPNCWALPVVTLTSIAITIAASHVGKGKIKSLQRAVDESLNYVRLVDTKLDVRGLINMRKAADIVWLGIDIYDCWLGNDLKKLAHTEKTPTKILKKLAKLGKEYVSHHIKEDEKDKDPHHRQPKVLAANTMYRTCRNILLRELGTADRIFEWLQKTIADILGACLTNLPRVISMECVCSSIEIREESVREAAYLLGEAEKIFTQEETMRRDPSRRFDDIDDWISKQNRSFVYTSCSLEEEDDDSSQDQETMANSEGQSSIVSMNFEPSATN